ncbi:MAG: NAD(P)H-hydrate dehydratase [Nitrospirae bacterium]|nr:MAG: NAD(P)H-hydrate dehydratase [Nitrospirota bacterium]
MKLVTAKQMQDLDRRTIEEAGVPGAVLMERAGTGVVSVLERTWGAPAGKVISVFCGKGNNGGDGFVVARILRQKGATVHVCLLAHPDHLKGDARSAFQQLTRVLPSTWLHILPEDATIHALLGDSALVIDALLGTGLSSPVSGRYAEVIKAINSAGRPTIAVDIPSGLHADSGTPLETAVRATQTVTFGCPKLGLYQGPAVDFVGQIEVIDIGIPSAFVGELSGVPELLTPELIAYLLPIRPPSAHKGTCGHVGIIAGSPGKTGAAALAARAALRIGAGLVTVATPRGANAALEAKLLEVMTLPLPETSDHTLSEAALEPLKAFIKDRRAVAIGPGLTTHPETVTVVRHLLSSMTRPCVVDADALNALAGSLDLFGACASTPILTPHPGEMARLLGSPWTAPRVNADRLAVAAQFSQTHRVVLVLKGARTVIAHPDGQTAICPTGNAGMATAGMGDVLTGILAGLLAQGLAPWDAARAGVYLHGLAGDLACQKYGAPSLLAGDLLDSLPHALCQLQRMSSTRATSLP